MTVALDHSPSRIVQQLLADLSLATLPEDDDDWPAYRNEMLDTPDSIIAVYDTVGLMGESGPFGKRLGRHGIQIIVRAPDPDTGWTKANAIATALDETISYNTVTITPDTGSADTYLVIALNRTADIAKLGQDKSYSKRYQFTINAYLVVRQTS